MLNFKKLELSDISVFREFLKYKSDNNCECTIGAAFLWRDYYETFFAVFEDMLFVKFVFEGREAYLVPLARDKERALEILRDYQKEHGDILELCAVAENELKVIDKVFAGYEEKKQRDSFDYLYNSEDMVNFAGRKYSGQRNHINKFKKLYEDYSFAEVTKENISEVKAFFESFLEKYDKGTESYRAEAEKIFEFLDNFDAYGMFGGVLKVEDEIIAMSFGEIVKDTMFIHIEKADIGYHGAYQMIVQQFAMHFVNEDVKFINREDDMGDEGLRKSKLSYQPVKLIEKSDVLIRL